jgi:serine/threonine-protein kinase
MSHCAPEKWLTPSSAGVPSDIFSVGVMLYKLLTGEPPFWADTYINLYEQIKRGEFQPASDRNRRVPDFLDLVLQELLYPSLEYRTPNAGAALALLQKIRPTMELWERQRHLRAP